MKIKLSQLKRIIKEEVEDQKNMNEPNPKSVNIQLPIDELSMLLDALEVFEDGSDYDDAAKIKKIKQLRSKLGDIWESNV